MFYTKAAAARILGVKANRIKGFQKWWRVVWVWVEGLRPQFISFDDFHQDFVSKRQEEARNIEIRSVGGGNYQAINPEKGTVYELVAGAEGIGCPCEDYSQQALVLEQRACCKHGYALLSYFGLDLERYMSFEQVLIANQEESPPRTFSGTQVLKTLNF